MLSMHYCYYAHLRVGKRNIHVQVQSAVPCVSYPCVDADIGTI